MSKLQVKIDGKFWQIGQLFIHGDTEPEAVINAKGKTTVDIEGLKKCLEEMMRKMFENKSCKYCKHFLEIPQKLSLGDLQQEYLRFCVISGLHEPIDDTWELEHELCFVRKESENAENKG